MNRSLFAMVFSLLACSFQVKAEPRHKPADNGYPVKVLKNNFLEVTVLLPDEEKDITGVPVSTGRASSPRLSTVAILFFRNGKTTMAP